MSDPTIPENVQRFNELVKAIKAYSNTDSEKLIQHLYVEKDYTLEEIAGVLGTTKQSLSQKYPNLAKAKKEKNHA